AVEDPAGGPLLLLRAQAFERTEHPHHLLEALGLRPLRPRRDPPLGRFEPRRDPLEETPLGGGGETAGDAPPEDPPLRPGGLLLERFAPGREQLEESPLGRGGETAGDASPEDPPLRPVGLLLGVLHALLEELPELLHPPGVEGRAVSRAEAVAGELEEDALVV